MDGQLFADFNPSVVWIWTKGGLFIFIYRQFFMNLPKTLEEAARLDGCGAVSTYWKIALPATGTSTLVTAVLAMVWHWNDYYEPAIYLQSEKLWPYRQCCRRFMQCIKLTSAGISIWDPFSRLC